MTPDMARVSSVRGRLSENILMITLAIVITALKNCGRDMLIIWRSVSISLV